jgi:hypothetical protein
MSASSTGLGNVAVKKQPDGDWKVAPNTPLDYPPEDQVPNQAVGPHQRAASNVPMQAIPEDNESVYAMSPIPEDDPPEDNPPQGNESVDEFIEDDNDPDKAAEKQIGRVNNDYFGKSPMDEARSILASGEDEKILTENGAPTQADLMSMGQGAMNNMALKLGIREDVMREWMFDETLHDQKDAVGRVIRSQIFVLITTPSPYAPDWKEICRRYQVGAQVKQERPEPKAMEIVNDKDRMAKQIVSILLETEEKGCARGTFS